MPIPWSVYTDGPKKAPAFTVTYDPLAAAAALYAFKQYPGHISACAATTDADATTMTQAQQMARHRARRTTRII